MAKTYTIPMPSVLIILLCAFLAWLKVSSGAAFSWWWVFAPIWLPVALVAGIWVAMLLFVIVGVLVAG